MNKILSSLFVINSFIFMHLYAGNLEIVRTLDTQEPLRSLVFGPEGKSLFYIQDSGIKAGKIQKVDLETGIPQEIADYPWQKYDDLLIGENLYALQRCPQNTSLNTFNRQNLQKISSQLIGFCTTKYEIHHDQENNEYILFLNNNEGKTKIYGPQIIMSYDFSIDKLITPNPIIGHKVMIRSDNLFEFGTVDTSAKKFLQEAFISLNYKTYSIANPCISMVESLNNKLYIASFDPHRPYWDIKALGTFEMQNNEIISNLLQQPNGEVFATIKKDAYSPIKKVNYYCMEANSFGPAYTLDLPESSSTQCKLANHNNFFALSIAKKIYIIKKN